MARDRVERRLAAIVAADVAGYSRLMGLDEVDTVRTLREHRVVTDALVAKHGGRLVKTTGDGVLLEFPSVVDAVECAVAVQAVMAQRNEGVPVDRRMLFRIGINLGDILIEGDDILGDGVNIAARLEGIAEPGGICISYSAYDQVRNKILVGFADLGEQQLKNIERPVRAYAVKSDSQPRTLPALQPATAKPLPLPDKPSIAVLPFQNMSGDPEQEYFADGMVEEIITALSRFKWLFVIARNSSFTYKGRAIDVKQVGRELGVRYVLEGSVRKSANRVRITGQLIDTATGAHLWADRFDGGVGDIFDLQDQVTESVVGAIAPAVEKAEIERAKRKPTESLDAYGLYLRGLASFYRGSRRSLTDALQFFERAIELDPDFASAYGMAAWCCIIRNNNGWLPDTEIELMRSRARQAARLGKDDPMALGLSGGFLAQVEGDLNAGAALLDRALILGPNLAAIWHLSGWVRLYLGDSKMAIEHMERAMRLYPLDPLHYGALNGLAAAYFLAGQYDAAAFSADRALQEQPNYSASLRMAAASYALAGQIAKAQSYMTRVLKIDPTLRVSKLKGIVPFRGSADAARYIDGLRRAGLAE